MKRISLFVLTLSVLVLFSSCTKDFTPATGNTKVEFVPAETFMIESAYFDIPVQQTEVSSTASVARVEIVNCTGKYSNGKEFNYVVDSTAFFTSNEIYVGPSPDEGVLGTASFELKLPQYLSIDTLAIELRLVGDNVGANSTMTYTFTAVEQYNMQGVFQIGEGQMAITATDDPLIYHISVTGEKEDEFIAERQINRLSISTDAYTASDGLEWYICAYDGEYLYPGTAVEFTFTSNDTFNIPSGIFVGYQKDGGWYYNGIIGTPGAQGTRVQ